MTLCNRIPTIDARELETNAATFGAALGRAWQDTGFVAVTGHGIENSVIEGCLQAAQDFFSLPAPVKQQYWIEGGGDQRGYTPFGIETAKDANAPDQKEFWHVGPEASASRNVGDDIPRNIWPVECASFRSSCLTFYNALDDLGRRLLSAIATYLELEPDYFEHRVANGNSILRLLHYPSCDSKNAGERAAAHEDINVVTLLVGADQAGLEVLRRDGTWVPINTNSDAIVCNVGDMLQRLTNHVLPSTTHRVVRPTGEDAKKPRYSIPYFLHFAPEVEITTLTNCVSAENPDRYPQPITAQDYLIQRLKEIGLS